MRIDTVLPPSCDGNTYGAVELLGPVCADPAANAAAATTPLTSSAAKSVFRILSSLPMD